MYKILLIFHIHLIYFYYTGSSEQTVVHGSNGINTHNRSSISSSAVAEVQEQQEVVDEDDSIHSNMVFDTLEDAYGYFRDYSSRYGFSIRKESSRKANGELCYQMFACSQSGLRRNEWSTKKSIRCNCPWNIKVWRNISKDTKQSSWKVSSCVNSHNHEMLFKPGSTIGDAQSSSSVASFPMERKHTSNSDSSVKDTGSTRARSDATIARDEHRREQKLRFHTLSALAKTWVSLSIEDEQNFKYAEDFLNTTIQQLRIAQEGGEVFSIDPQALMTTAELLSSSTKVSEPPPKKRKGKAHTEDVL